MRLLHSAFQACATPLVVTTVFITLILSYRPYLQQIYCYREVILRRYDSFIRWIWRRRRLRLRHDAALRRSPSDDRGRPSDRWPSADPLHHGRQQKRRVGCCLHDGSPGLWTADSCEICSRKARSPFVEWNFPVSAHIVCEKSQNAAAGWQGTRTYVIVSFRCTSCWLSEIQKQTIEFVLHLHISNSQYVW